MQSLNGCGGRDMTKANPPPLDQISNDELIERLIDTMTCLVSIEKDFLAAKLNLETISDILFDRLAGNKDERIQATLTRLKDSW